MRWTAMVSPGKSVGRLSLHGDRVNQNPAVCSVYGTVARLADRYHQIARTRNVRPSAAIKSCRLEGAGQLVGVLLAGGAVAV